MAKEVVRKAMPSIWPRWLLFIDNKKIAVRAWSRVTKDLSWVSTHTAASPAVKEAIAIRPIDSEPVAVPLLTVAGWNAAVAALGSKSKDTCLLYLDLNLRDTTATGFNELRAYWATMELPSDDYAEALFLAMKYDPEDISRKHVLVSASGYSDENSQFGKWRREGIINGSGKFLSEEQSQEAIVKGLNFWLKMNPVHSLDRLWQETRDWFCGSIDGYPHNWHDVDAKENRHRDWPLTLRRTLEAYLGSLSPDLVCEKLHNTMISLCGRNFDGDEDTPSCAAVALVFAMGVRAGLGSRKAHVTSVLHAANWTALDGMRARRNGIFKMPNIADETEKRTMVRCIKAFYNLGVRLAVDKESKAPSLQSIAFNADGGATIKLSFAAPEARDAIIAGANQDGPADYWSPKTCDVARFVLRHGGAGLRLSPADDHGLVISLCPA